MRKQIGQLGEGLAANYLTAHNHQIITTNFRCRRGELDIIAVDYSNRRKPQLAFIEVKTRRTTTFGQPQDSVTLHKRRKMLITAQHFLQQSTQKLPHIWRFDIIAIKLTHGHPPNLTHFKHIFDG